MSAMVTTCSHCQTTFKVSSEQLNAHEGDVRCGQCATVFNAYDSLASSKAQYSTIIAPPEITPVQQTMTDIPAVTHDNKALQPEEFPDYPFEALEQITYSGVPDPGLVTETQNESLAAPLEFSPATEIRYGKTPPLSILPVMDDLQPDEAEAAPAPTKKRTWPWMIGAFLLLLALLCQPVLFRYQLAYFAGNNFNNHSFGVHGALAQTLTELGAELVVLCNHAPCPGHHDLLKYSDNMSIDSSELQADPTRSTVVILNAVLRNHAQFAQSYPSLELTLTDTEDKATARRTFKPAEYLPNKPDTSAINRGMHPGEEVTIKLYLDTQTIKATGYRLYVYYP